MNTPISLKFGLLHPFIDCESGGGRGGVNGTRGLLSFAIHLHLDYVIATVAKGSLTPFINGGRGCKCTRTMVPFSFWDIIIGI